jgi:hypothetical protein
MYSVSDAIRALFKFHTDQGYDERRVMQPSSHNFDPDDGYTFVHRDADGKITFKVEFHDDAGNATVTVKGDPESPQDVNTRDDEDDDEI